MAGVMRPYTVSDIIGSLQDQIGAVSSASSTSAGTGFFSEADETAGFTDTVTATVQVQTATTTDWGAGTWGCMAWG